MYQLNAGSGGVLGDWNDPYNAARFHIDISPDRHYLVIGGRTLRVWDLWNLTNDFEQNRRTYQHLIDERVISSLHFIDNQTVEIQLDNGNFIQMNVVTGERR